MTPGNSTQNKGYQNIFLISKNKQAKQKQKQKYKKAKETKEEKRISLKNQVKNKFVAAGVKILHWHFTSHLQFQKQEYYLFWPRLLISINCIHELSSTAIQCQSGYSAENWYY